MVNIKEMPAKEKYDNIAAAIKLTSYVDGFIEKNLGSKALAEYQEESRKGIKPIPENASDEEKYEIIYSNFMWMGATLFSFVRKRMGENGLNHIIRTDVEELKRANASPAMWMVKLIKALAPGTAFTMMAKKIAYNLQWTTPFTVPELSRNRMVMDVPHCKVLDYPGADDICVIACQKIYGLWFAEQFGLELKTERKDSSCVMTVSPLK